MHKGCPLDPAKKKYDPATREKLEQVEAEEWEDTLARALSFARSKTKFISLFDCRLDAEELVREAVARAFGVGTGKFDNVTFRNWNQDKYPLLVNFLRSIIRSMVGHIIKEHAGIDFLPTNGNDDIHADKVEGLIQQKRPSETPESSLLNVERAGELLKALEKISAKDEEIGMFLLAVEDGYSKAADQAEATGYDAQQIYNIRKRLKRNLEPFLDKHN
jgi:DNA-directed RNA polymerase specialized sigma24 family protein